MIAKNTSRKIEDLDPRFQPLVEKLLDQAAHLYPFITDGSRTLASQAELYEKAQHGGPHAVAPGYSYHNYGLAVDIAFLRGGKLSYDLDSYRELRQVAYEVGIENIYDMGQKDDQPHFQFPGTNIKKIRQENANQSNVQTMPDNQVLLSKLEGKTYIVTDGPEKGRIYLVSGKVARWANPDAETAYAHGISLDKPDAWLSHADHAGLPKGTQLQFKDGWLIPLFREMKKRGVWSKIDQALN